MNKYAEVICVAGLLTILSTASAIASNVSKSEKSQYHSAFVGFDKDAVQSGVSLTSRVCEGSLAQISVEDLSKNIKTDSILEDSSAIATPASGIASQKSTTDAAKASFWWAADQFDPFNGKLIQNWVASSQKEQIDMTVDWQLWTLLDYFGRYRFVNQFGTVARKHGYNLIVFDRQNRCLASYKYNAGIRPPKWELNLENYGEDSLQVEPLRKFNEFQPQL